MTTLKYKTNLNCGSCVAAVTPHLNAERSIKRWSVDTADPDKVLTVEGEQVAPQTVERLVADAGFRVLGEVGHPAAEEPDKKSLLAIYYPLLLVFGYLVGVVALLEVGAGSFDWMRAMGRFMGGFFLVFSFFKLLDLRGFVDSFRSYDVLARRLPAYGWAYPFIELLLGVAYTLAVLPVATNLVTLVVMVIGTVGVAQALLQKRRIQCACLGSVLNLPMSSVTLFEDVLMAAMAAAMLAGLYVG
jgi:copper chaperone CopZ